MRARLLIEEFDKVCLAAAALVRLGFCGALREELDGRIGANPLLLCCSHCIGRFSVNLSDQDAGFADEVIGDALPDWSQRFAIWHSSVSARSSTFTQPKLITYGHTRAQ